VTEGIRKADQVRLSREVVSFVRRSARLSPQQRKAWDAHHSSWVLDVPTAQKSTSVDPGYQLDLAAAFGRLAPLIVEIGPGMGGSLVPMAKARPEANVLAFEVYQPAVARILAKLAAQQVTNVRLVTANAVEGLTTLVPKSSIEQLWLFFPDPWPKSRHAKRRLLTVNFVDLAASRMKPSSLWRLATDSPDYARQMRRLLDSHDAFMNEHPAGWAPRWDARPVTRFEDRGIEADRCIFDLCYRRR
jgi:tRNA (guanine-N7-)-methyltransferase